MLYTILKRGTFCTNATTQDIYLHMYDYHLSPYCIIRNIATRCLNTICIFNSIIVNIMFFRWTKFLINYNTNQKKIICCLYLNQYTFIPLNYNNAIKTVSPYKEYYLKQNVKHILLYPIYLYLDPCSLKRIAETDHIIRRIMRAIPVNALNNPHNPENT